MAENQNQSTPTLDRPGQVPRCWREAPGLEHTVNSLEGPFTPLYEYSVMVTGSFSVRINTQSSRGRPCTLTEDAGSNNQSSAMKN